jgi:hypothetical protein
LKPNEPGDFTKLGMALQVATKTSMTCKDYLNGIFHDASDKSFGGVEELLDACKTLTI